MNIFTHQFLRPWVQTSTPTRHENRSCLPCQKLSSLQPPSSCIFHRTRLHKKVADPALLTGGAAARCQGFVVEALNRAGGAAKLAPRSTNTARGANWAEVTQNEFPAPPCWSHTQFTSESLAPVCAGISVSPHTHFTSVSHLGFSDRRTNATDSEETVFFSCSSVIRHFF